MARSWYDKFADAGRGLRVAVTGHNSFIVHLVCAVGVCGLAVWLNLQLWRWVPSSAVLSWCWSWS